MRGAHKRGELSIYNASIAFLARCSLFIFYSISRSNHSFPLTVATLVMRSRGLQARGLQRINILCAHVYRACSLRSRALATLDSLRTTALKEKGLRGPMGLFVGNQHLQTLVGLSARAEWAIGACVAFQALLRYA